jgi:hypothetical protein
MRRHPAKAAQVVGPAVPTRSAPAVWARFEVLRGNRNRLEALRITSVTPKAAKPPPHRSGSANTHKVDPPSGFFMSGTSVDSERPSPDPLPVATATYCLPLTL